MPEKLTLTVMGELIVDLENDTIPGLHPSTKNKESLLDPFVPFFSVNSSNGGELKLDFLKNIPLSKYPSRISAIASFIVWVKLG